MFPDNRLRDRSARASRFPSVIDARFETALLLVHLTSSQYLTRMIPEFIIAFSTAA